MTGLDNNLSAQSPDAEPNKAEASKGDKVGENAIPRERPEQKIQQKESVVGTTKDKLEATKIEVGGFATPQKTETQPVVPKTPEEEDPGTSKSAMDKISDGMQKVFAMVEKFMKQIQSMGSATLRGMASTLAMLGFKPAEKWLNEMAGADYAELTSTLKKGNLKIAAISPDDPEAKAKGEAAERGQAQLADRFKSLAQTRGPAFTREMYYSEVVAAWKKKSGNVSKTEITHNDLLDMAVTAQELPATLPGQVAQPQQAQEMFQAIGFDQLPANVSVMNKPFSFPMETGSAITAQLLQENGRVQVVVNGQKYGIVAGGHALTDLSTDVQKEANGALLFQNRDGSQVRLEKATLQAIVRSIVAGKGANSLDVTGGEVVGVNAGSQILLSPNQKLSALSLVRIS
ncbi:MAG: hypothetical protein WC353_02405 [Candidatus Peribacter sp.]|jgi:hypothetical protein